MKQKSSSGGRVQKGLYVRAGENADLLFSLAVASAINPHESTASFADDSSLHIALYLCWVKSVCAWNTSRTCKHLQMQNTAFHTQSDPGRSTPAVTFAVGQAGEVILSCFLPQNNEAGTFC